MPDTSEIARRQMRAWGDSKESRVRIARKMYALRLGEVLPSESLEALRGMEGARMKRTYQVLAQQYGLVWRGRRYDRSATIYLVPSNFNAPSSCVCAILHAPVRESM